MAFAGFEIVPDSRFSGCYVPPPPYESNPDAHALMVELRRDLYLDKLFQLVEPALAPIVSALASLVDVIAGPNRRISCTVLVSTADLECEEDDVRSR